MSNQQYRPILPTPPASDADQKTRDQYTRDLHTQLNQAFRQAFDNIYNQANSNSPTSLFMKGSGKTVAVPASTTKPGTGFGLSVTLNRPGTWVLTASVALNVVGDANEPFILSLAIGSIFQAQTAVVQQSANGSLMMHQSWQVNSNSGTDLCTLYIRKKAGSGTSNVDPGNSTLTGTWQGS